MKTCKHCGKQFTGRRSTRKFCSNNCRVSWNARKNTKSSQALKAASKYLPDHVECDLCGGTKDKWYIGAHSYLYHGQRYTVFVCDDCFRIGDTAERGRTLVISEYSKDKNRLACGGEISNSREKTLDKIKSGLTENDIKNLCL